MAKFLVTSGVSYHLEEIIRNTQQQLILISPYLQFSERIREHLQNLHLQKRDIRVVYREDKLQKAESEWLSRQIGIRTSLCKNLHAKCYINESAAIITSMNLYEFSQVNNNEMGILLTRRDDRDLFEETMAEAQRLLKISDEIRIGVQPVSNGKAEAKIKEVKKIAVPIAVGNKKNNGFCIRTGAPIPFDLEKPLSYEAYKSWSKYSDPDYPEKYCHFSGEPSDGSTSVAKPIMKKNWKKANAVHGDLTGWGSDYY